jgi:DNA-binding transcriptional ArsR family regulator
MSHAETFTAGELREISRSDASSLTRDLNALEAADLLVASPPAAERRQGQRTVYRVAEDAASRFRRLAELVDEASLRTHPRAYRGLPRTERPQTLNKQDSLVVRQSADLVGAEQRALQRAL